MYTNHWSLVNTIQKLNRQAQLLLEEANILTGRDFILQQEIKTHVSKITRTELHKRLCKPTQFHFEEMPPPPPNLITNPDYSPTPYLLHLIRETHKML